MCTPNNADGYGFMISLFTYGHILTSGTHSTFAYFSLWLISVLASVCWNWHFLPPSANERSQRRVEALLPNTQTSFVLSCYHLHWDKLCGSSSQRTPPKKRNYTSMVVACDYRDGVGSFLFILERIHGPTDGEPLLSRPDRWCRHWLRDHRPSRRRRIYSGQVLQTNGSSAQRWLSTSNRVQGKSSISQSKTLPFRY